MIQCSDCEYYTQGPDGAPRLVCDPFSTIKEPECLTKWQFVKLDTMVRSYTATLRMYERLAPLQEKMFRHIEREIDDTEESDSWKFTDEDEDDDDDAQNPGPFGG